MVPHSSWYSYNIYSKNVLLLSQIYNLSWDLTAGGEWWSVVIINSSSTPTSQWKWYKLIKEILRVECLVPLYYSLPNSFLTFSQNTAATLPESSNLLENLLGKLVMWKQYFCKTERGHKHLVYRQMPTTTDFEGNCIIFFLIVRQNQGLYSQEMFQSVHQSSSSLVSGPATPPPPPPPAWDCPPPGWTWAARSLR